MVKKQAQSQAISKRAKLAITTKGDDKNSIKNQESRTLKQYFALKTEWRQWWLGG